MYKWVIGISYVFDNMFYKGKPRRASFLWPYTHTTVVALCVVCYKCYVMYMHLDHENRSKCKFGLRWHPLYAASDQSCPIYLTLTEHLLKCIFTKILTTILFSLNKKLVSIHKTRYFTLKNHNYDYHS